MSIHAGVSTPRPAHLHRALGQTCWEVFWRTLQAHPKVLGHDRRISARRGVGLDSATRTCARLSSELPAQCGRSGARGLFRSVKKDRVHVTTPFAAFVPWLVGCRVSYSVTRMRDVPRTHAIARLFHLAPSPRRGGPEILEHTDRIELRLPGE